MDGRLVVCIVLYLLKAQADESIFDIGTNPVTVDSEIKTILPVTEISQIDLESTSQSSKPSTPSVISTENLEPQTTKSSELDKSSNLNATSQGSTEEKELNKHETLDPALEKSDSLGTRVNFQTPEPTLFQTSVLSETEESNQGKMSDTLIPTTSDPKSDSSTSSLQSTVVPVLTGSQATEESVIPQSSAVPEISTVQSSVMQESASSEISVSQNPETQESLVPQDTETLKSSIPQDSVTSQSTMPKEVETSESSISQDSVTLPSTMPQDSKMLEFSTPQSSETPESTISQNSETTTPVLTLSSERSDSKEPAKSGSEQMLTTIKPPEFNDAEEAEKQTPSIEKGNEMMENNLDSFEGGNCSVDCSFSGENLVCGSDKIVYQNECDLKMKTCGRNVKVDSWENCRGKHPLCPDECLNIQDPVCGDDGKIYPNLCLMYKFNCGKKMKTYHLVRCFTNLRGFRRVDNACPKVCPELYRPICGSDRKIYSNECFLRIENCGKNDVHIVDMSECVTTPKCPHSCTPLPDPVCGSDGLLYLNHCYFANLNCGKDTEKMPRSFCEQQQQLR